MYSLNNIYDLLICRIDSHLKNAAPSPYLVRLKALPCRHTTPYAILNLGVIPITPLSIHEIPGTPIEGINLEVITAVKSDNSITASWKAQFVNPTIRPRDVDAILNSKNSIITFKLDF